MASQEKKGVKENTPCEEETNFAIHPTHARTLADDRFWARWRSENKTLPLPLH